VHDVSAIMTVACRTRSSTVMGSARSVRALGDVEMATKQGWLLIDGELVAAYGPE